MTDTSQSEQLPLSAAPQTNGEVDTFDEDDRNKMRPADIDADMREMERRKRVEMIMNSRLFREELERIIETQLKEGSGPAGLLQQISDMMGVQGGRLNSGAMFKSSNCVIPINDIRGVESMGYAKGEKILRCKLAAVYRLMDLYGWTQGIYNHITARLNQDQEHFLINPFGMLYHEITASSLIKVDMQGSVVEQGTTNFGVNISGFMLHAAIHAARPDIKCIIHVHTPSVLAVSSLKSGLLPLCQEAIVIGEVSQHPYLGGLFEPEEREKIGRNLGPINKVLFLANHGAVCCGETVEEAFFNVYNTVLACETQIKLIPVGIENLVLVSDETRKQVYEAARRHPDSVPKHADASDLPPSGKKEKQFRIGVAEFEALMRMLDNSGFRTGYIYRNPLVKGDPPRPRNDVEVPPAVSSLGYLLEEEEMYRQGNWKKYADGRKTHDRTRWLNSPNVYQKVEILETGTPDPKKITKWVDANTNAEEWVAEGSPTHSSTPMKIDAALQFVPKGTNPKEFKKLQQQIKDNRRADKITSGPQSHILEGVSWEEAKMLQDANLSQTGDQIILVGAASKGIIQRGFQHNAMVYKTPYAKNPFDQVTDEDIEEYKKTIERKQRGESFEDYSESEPLSSSLQDSRPTNHSVDAVKSPLMSPTSAASETEEESRDEPRVLRIETKQVPRPSQAEHVLSDADSDMPDPNVERAKSLRLPAKVGNRNDVAPQVNRSWSLDRNKSKGKDHFGKVHNCEVKHSRHLYSPASHSVPNQFVSRVARFTALPSLQKPILTTLPTPAFSTQSLALSCTNKKPHLQSIGCKGKGSLYSFLPMKHIMDTKMKPVKLVINSSSDESSMDTSSDDGKDTMTPLSSVYMSSDLEDINNNNISNINPLNLVMNILNLSEVVVPLEHHSHINNDTLDDSGKSSETSSSPNCKTIIEVSPQANIDLTLVSGVQTLEMEKHEGDEFNITGNSCSNNLNDNPVQNLYRSSSLPRIPMCDSSTTLPLGISQISKSDTNLGLLAYETNISAVKYEGYKLFGKQDAVGNEIDETMKDSSTLVNNMKSDTLAVSGSSKSDLMLPKIVCDVIEKRRHIERSLSPVAKLKEFKNFSKESETVTKMVLTSSLIIENVDNIAMEKCFSTLAPEEKVTTVLDCERISCAGTRDQTSISSYQSDLTQRQNHEVYASLTATDSQCCSEMFQNSAKVIEDFLQGSKNGKDVSVTVNDSNIIGIREKCIEESSNKQMVSVENSSRTTSNTEDNLHRLDKVCSSETVVNATRSLSLSPILKLMKIDSSELVAPNSSSNVEYQETDMANVLYDDVTTLSDAGNSASHILDILSAEEFNQNLPMWKDFPVEASESFSLFDSTVSKQSSVSLSSFESNEMQLFQNQTDDSFEYNSEGTSYTNDFEEDIMTCENNLDYQQHSFSEEQNSPRKMNDVEETQSCVDSGEPAANFYDFLQIVHITESDKDFTDESIDNSEMHSRNFEQSFYSSENQELLKMKNKDQNLGLSTDVKSTHGNTSDLSQQFQYNSCLFTSNTTEFYSNVLDIEKSGFSSETNSMHDFSEYQCEDTADETLIQEKFPYFVYTDDDTNNISDDYSTKEICVNDTTKCNNGSHVENSLHSSEILNEKNVSLLEFVAPCNSYISFTDDDNEFSAEQYNTDVNIEHSVNNDNTCETEHSQLGMCSETFLSAKTHFSDSSKVESVQESSSIDSTFVTAIDETFNFPYLVHKAPLDNDKLHEFDSKPNAETQYSKFSSATVSVHKSAPGQINSDENNANCNELKCGVTDSDEFVRFDFDIPESEGCPRIELDVPDCPANSVGFAYFGRDINLGFNVNSSSSSNVMNVIEFDVHTKDISSTEIDMKLDLSCSTMSMLTATVHNGSQDYCQSPSSSSQKSKNSEKVNINIPTSPVGKSKSTSSKSLEVIPEEHTTSPKIC